MLIPDDDNYKFYSQNLKKISELPKDLGYHGIIPENISIDISKNSIKDSKLKINNKKEFLNYENQEVLPLGYDYQDKYNNRYNTEGELKNKFFYSLKSDRDFLKEKMKFITYNINRTNRPLKSGCQRQWEETEGPNFVDPDYIYPGKN